MMAQNRKQWHLFFQNMDRKLQPFQYLTSGDLKTVALVLMLVEHFFKIFTAPIVAYFDVIAVQDFAVTTLYHLTAIAFALFAFLLTEGFVHTHDRKKYRRDMLLFALLSEIPLDLVFIGSGWNIQMDIPLLGIMQGGATIGGFVYLGYQNIFFTLFLGLWTMELLEKVQQKQSGWKRWLFYAVVVGVIGFLASLARFDYGFEGILLIALLYVWRGNRLYQCMVVPLLMIALQGEQPNVYTLLYVVLLLFYNGKRYHGQKKHSRPNLKYVAYAIYPVHLLIFAILRF